LWIRASSNPGSTNQFVINDYFEQILNDIENFKKYPCKEEEVKKIYEKLLKIYYEKLIDVYQIPL